MSRGRAEKAAGLPVASVATQYATTTHPAGGDVLGQPTSAGGDGWELRLGRWQTALAGVLCDCLLFDAPYSSTTHAAETTRSDDSDAAGLTPDYDAMTPDAIREFCESWATQVEWPETATHVRYRAPRCRGWWVSITDSELHPTWVDEMNRVGLYAFKAPVPVFIPGMSVRMQGDGPSSWTLYAAVARPRTIEFARWGTLPGYYGPIGTETRGRAGGSSRGGGRGKQRAITDAFVRDYSKRGDVVVDPFAGWGGTLASAVSYGRKAIGSEMDADAHAEAVKRLKRPLQVDMFAGGAL